MRFRQVVYLVYHCDCADSGLGATFSLISSRFVGRLPIVYLKGFLG